MVFSEGWMKKFVRKVFGVCSPLKARRVELQLRKAGNI